LPPSGSRLGIRWAKAQPAKGPIVVSDVTPGSPAARAGIRAGDKLLTFAGREVQSIAAFRLSVLAASNRVAATLERAGVEQPIEVTLELAGEPVRVGLTWRSDDAGVRVNERIYRIDGQAFADGAALRALATTLEGTLILEVESAGRLRSVEIPPVEEQLAKLNQESAGKVDTRTP
jgi:C-terminal processing protease CtpA/Prc